MNVKLGNTSDEMVALMQSGEYDGVSASGDATERLIAGGEVGPLDVSQLPSYEQIFEDLKLQQWNSVDGEPYGMPHGRGANLLVYNTEAFADGAPDSWSVVFEGGTPADGAVSIYDSAIYIADAARLPDGDATRPRDHQPVRPRRGPSSPRRSRCSNSRQALVGQYWALYTDQQAALEGGTVLAGTTWQVIVNLAQANGATIDAVKPVEGATGWSDTWMVSTKAANPNCMLLWMDWITSPWANAQVAEWFGEAPSNSRVLRADRGARALRHLPRRGHRVLGGRLVLDDADRGVHRRAHRRRRACRTRSGSTPGTSSARDDPGSDR